MLEVTVAGIEGDGLVGRGVYDFVMCTPEFGTSQAITVLRRFTGGDPAPARERMQLARTLAEDPRHLAPARALAEQAAQVLTAAGASTDAEVARAWLAAHPG